MIINTGISELDRMLCPEIPTEEVVLLPCHVKEKDKCESGKNNNCPLVFKKEKTGTEKDKKDRMEKGEKWEGGIFVPRRENPNHSVSTGKSNNILSPIIVVEGSSGDGKTSLSLHIACNLARKGFLCMFFSLELSPENIRQAIKGYGKFQENSDDENKNGLQIINLELEKAIPNEFSSGQIILPRISPLSVVPVSVSKNQDFDLRYKDIRKALEWIDRQRQDMPIFCFIDSLSAISNSALSRETIQQLFNLFREHQAPLLATIERQNNWLIQKDWENFFIARYLADIEIKLESFFQEEDGYFRQTIEVAKTRYNRRTLGRHQMKLKSPQKIRTGNFDPRFGIVIYPSIDYHLSKYQEETMESTNQYLTIIDNDDLPVGYFEESKNPKNPKKGYYGSNSCFVVSGPPGGHKFALAFNLLINQGEDINTKIWKPGRKLIISLAEEGTIQLEDIAMHKGITGKYLSWKNSIKLFEENGQKEKTSTIIENTWKYNKDKTVLMFSALNFRMGQMMPEQFLYIIRNYLQVNSSIDGILFDNTAHIRNRFPTIARNPLFLPTLVDMFKSLNRYSVFIDVRDNSTGNDHMSQSLLAAADCRLIVFRNEIGAENKLLINNVRGKQYDNNVRIINVINNDQNMNQLIIRKEKKKNKWFTNRHVGIRNSRLVKYY